MMGRQSSETKGGGAEPSTPAKTDSQPEADLSSYEAAHAIRMIAAGLGPSLSFNTLRGLFGSDLETNQEVAKIILERSKKDKKDIWDEDLFSLVEEYFENSKKTLDFCTALDNCLRRARNNQSIMQSAFRRYEEEVGLQVGPDEKKFVKTLQELRRFKTAEEPFTKEFFALSDAVRRKQESMLRKLQDGKGKLDKKLESLKKWSRVSKFLFVATFVFVFIFPVLAAAIKAGRVVIALAGVLAVPINSLGKWRNGLWKRIENKLRGQEELISKMEGGSVVTHHGLENIRVLVRRLEIRIESMLHNADFALREEDEVKLVIEDIKRKLEEFVETIETLSRQADTYSRNIRWARTIILQGMTRQAGSNRSITEDSSWDV